MDKQQARQIIRDTFEKSFDKKRFAGFIKNLLNRIEDAPFTYQGNYIPDAYKQHIKTLERIGKFSDGENSFDILVITLQKETSLERARTMQRNFIAWYLNGSRGGVLKDAALAAFVSPDAADWRFSLVKMDYKFEKNKTGRMKVKEEFTPARRWSFLVGVNEKSHTAQSRLVDILANDEQAPSLEEIEKAFDIETVTKEFFLKYRELFLRTKEELDRVILKDPKIKADFEAKGVDTVNFAKKLLGQIIFLYFLQKKGWFGVGRDDDWGTGSKHFLRELFDKKHSDYKNFYNDILEPLFYEALRIDRSHDDGYYSRFNCKIPFLNGGLFDPIGGNGGYDWVHIDIIIPGQLFSNTTKTKEGDTGDGILDIFDRFNFTVKEDEPLEKEVAIDPELLGKAYEKFNAIRPDNYDEFKKALKSGKKGEENKFNKKFGVYYTPREIVHYMCQQSLINYLATELSSVIPSEARNLKEDLETLIHIGEQVSEREETALIKEQNIKEGKQKTSGYKLQLSKSIRSNAALIDQKLAEVTVCDPAVGSGAFPVGMMSEIVKTRNVLSVLLKDNSRNAYDFKRRCIEHSLYGVDIDPGAVEIAKLRLWLSLVVDEDDYHSIRPLPNLDYKIMQGNSLIEDFHGISLDLGKSGNGGLFGIDLKLESLIKELHEKQNAFFNATHPRDKHRLKDAVEEAILAIFRYRLVQEKKSYFDHLWRIEQFASTLPEKLREQYRREEKEKLNKRFDFDPEDVERELREMTHGNKLRSFFPWRLYFADVFRNKGGFDVVIANPPYVRQELISEQKPLLKEAFPDVYHGVADLYVYFYRRALDITRSSGCVAFISSNKFFRAGYGEKLRAYLQNNTRLKTVIDFGDLPIFEAITYPCVLVISNHRPDDNQSTTQALNVRDIETIEHLPAAVAHEGWPQPQRSLRREGWALERPEVLNLLEKLRDRGTPLGEYVGGRLYYGIKTGFNKAFVIDQATRDRLIAEDPRSAEIIKPWLRGRDVKRWWVDWAGQYLLWTYKGMAIEKYPAVFEYLSQFREKLAKRWEPSRGQCEWYELRPCDYYTEFEKPKIVWPDIAKRCEFAFDNQNLFPDCTLFIVPNADLYLVGILNSTVVEWFYRHVSPTIQQDFLRFKRIYLNQIPIPDATSPQRAAIESLVRHLLDAGGQGSQVAKWEQELNALVYELYRLTDKEIRIIEESICNA